MKTSLVVLLVCILSAAAVLLLRKRTTTFWNPIDSKGYSADWRTYQSQDRDRDRQRRTTLDHIRLLNEQVLYERDIGIERLAEFLKSIEAVVNADVGKNAGAKCQLLIEVTLSRARAPTFLMSTQGKAQHERLQTIYNELTKVGDLRSREAELTFLMQFDFAGAK